MGVCRDCPILSGTPYYLRNGKSYGFQIWPVNSGGPSEQNPIKNFGEKDAWVYPGAANFLGTPFYLRNGKSYGFQIWPVNSQGPSEQKPIKILEKRECARIQGLSKFFEDPRLSQEPVKLQTSNFVRTFVGSIRTKTH